MVNRCAPRGRTFLPLLFALLSGCGGGSGGPPPPPDTVPNSFNFTAQADVAPGATVDSPPVAITGLAAPANVSITGGQYAIAGGAFTSANGTITNQQSIVVRVTAASDTHTPVTATVTIGGVSASFTATTLPDTEPAGFGFADQLGVALDAVVDSPAVAIGGIDVPVPIAITGGQYAIDGGAFTDADGVIADGQLVVARVVAPSSFNTSATAAITIGGIAATFTVTTVPDTIPDAFSFTDQIDVPLGVEVDSAAVVISGIEAPSQIAIAGGRYAIDGGAFTDTPGFIDAGQFVVVRVTAAPRTSTTVEAALTIGGVSDTFSATTFPDLTPPSATVMFPPLTSRTSADTIRFRGTAEDDFNPIVAVRVNGILAASSDGFANWSASVPLAPNVNVVTIETEDSEGNVDSTAVQATVRRRVRFGDVRSIALGREPDTILAVDSASRSLTRVGLVTDERQIVSDNEAGGPHFAFLIPRTVVVDPVAANDRAFVLDPSLGAVMSVDLSNGVRTVFSDATTPDDVNPIVSAADMALDAAHDRLLVVDAVLKGLIAVDLVTGARTILSDPTTPTAANPLTAPRDIAIDVTNNRALVTDALSTVYSVDLASGERAVFVPASGIDPLLFPAPIAVDEANGRLLVAQWDTDSILAFDLGTSARTVLTSPSVPNAVDPIGDVGAIAVDAANERLLVMEQDPRRRLFSVALAGGERTILASEEAGGAANPFHEPKGIMLDAANGRALVTDPPRAAVIAVDLSTAERTVFSGAGVPSSANPFSLPGAIVPDLASNRAFVLDEYRGGVDDAEIMSMDLSSGARTVVTDAAFPDANNPLTVPTNMTLDPARARLLVSDPTAGAVLAVDIGSGARTIFSSASVPDPANPYTEPRGIVIDEQRNRGLIANSTLSFASQLLALDVVSGARTVFSSNTVPGPQNSFSNPTWLTLDAGNDRLFLVDALQMRISTVDLATGARLLLSYNGAPFPANPFGGPEAIAYNAEREILYVVNRWFDGVLAVDVTTGHRVYVMQ